MALDAKTVASPKLNRLDHVDAIAGSLARGRKVRDRARPSFAVNEVIPDHHMTRAECLAQNTLCEVVGREIRKRSIEWQRENNVEVQSLEQFQLHRQRR